MLEAVESSVLCCASSFQLCRTLWISASSILCLWNSPGKNTGEGFHALIPGTFQTQGLNPSLLRLLHCTHLPESLFLLGPSLLPGRPLALSWDDSAPRNSDSSLLHNVYRKEARGRSCDGEPFSGQTSLSFEGGGLRIASKGSSQLQASLSPASVSALGQLWPPSAPGHQRAVPVE